MVLSQLGIAPIILEKLMRILALVGALAIAVAVGAAIFFFGGFYSVAATAVEPGIINWALLNVRVASINRRATENSPTSLDDPSAVQAGARAFAASGCLNCHGGPGVKWAKFTEGMMPYPPDLKDIAKDREAPQLFWVVKNGIKIPACRASARSECRTRKSGLSWRSSRSCRPCRKRTSRCGQLPRRKRLIVGGEQ